MDKEEAMKILKDFHDKSALFSVRTALETLHPELKESEDEKIRKEIMDFIDTKTIDSDERRNRWFSYLEKYKPVSFTSLEDTKVKMSLMQYISELNQDVVHLHPGIETCNEWIAWLENIPYTIDHEKREGFHLGYKAALEKQGDSPIKWNKNTEGNKPQINHSVLMKTTHCIAEGEWKGEYWEQYRWAGVVRDSDVLSWIELSDLDKQGEQKPTDKVEPKFNVGDWIINRTDATIMQIVNNIDFYESVEIGGQRRTDSYNYVEWDFRLWTIQDAKPGDVIYLPNGNDEYYFFIFKGIENAAVMSFAHFYQYNDGTFEVEGTIDNLFSVNDVFQPAIKEQRDLLFQNMKEAGYEWDAEKKELKKIHIIDEGKAEMDYCFSKMMNGEKVSSAWSEEDECYMSECIGAIATKDGWSFEEKRKTKHWLKSLKQRYTWKPSDKQMEALDSVIDEYDGYPEFDSLVSLKNDLSKL